MEPSTSSRYVPPLPLKNTSSANEQQQPTKPQPKPQAPFAYSEQPQPQPPSSFAYSQQPQAQPPPASLAYSQQPQPMPPPASSAYSQQPHFQPPPVIYQQAQPQPVPAYPYQAAPPQVVFCQSPVAAVAWENDFCGCFDDVGNCCLTMWFPCITFGLISSKVDKTSSSVPSALLYCIIMSVAGGGCWYSFRYRTKLRQMYMLEEDCCGDFCTHFCCEYCALCQEYRELNKRGSMEGDRQLPAVTIAPIAHPGMTR